MLEQEGIQDIDIVVIDTYDVSSGQLWDAHQLATHEEAIKRSVFREVYIRCGMRESKWEEDKIEESEFYTYRADIFRYIAIRADAFSTADPG
jgi:hypothetical protein